MKKYRNKIIVGLLLFALIIGICLPGNQIEAKSKVKVTIKNGVCTVSGKGAMKKSQRPSKKKRKTIKKVVIKNGVTSIPALAFASCTKLKTVSISKSVTSLGAHAFENTALTSLTIPSTVKTIGNFLVGNCKSLKSLEIPGDFKMTYSSMWSDEEATIINSTRYPLDTVTFSTPLNIEWIGFFEAHNYVVPENDPNFTTIDGLLYSKDGKTLIRVPLARTEVDVPEGTEKILYSAFEYAHDYDEDPWGGLTSLTSVTFPESLKHLTNDEYQVYDGEFAFDGLETFIVKSKDIPQEEVDAFWKSHPYICVCKAFAAAGYYDVDPDFLITKDDLPNKNGDYLYSYMGNDTDIIIPDKVETIGDRCFAENETIESVTMSHVKTIGNGAFHYCYNLTSVTLNDGLESIGVQAFASTGLTSLTLPDTLTTLGNSFIEYTKIKSIVVPESVVNWDEYGVFSNADKLEEVTLPDNTTTIKESAFEGCESLKTIKGANNLEVIEKSAFEYTEVDIQSLLDRPSLKTIGTRAFYMVPFTDITIPEHIEAIDSYAFYAIDTKTPSTVVFEGEPKLGTHVFHDRKLLTLTFTKIESAYAELFEQKDYSTYKVKDGKVKLPLHWQKITNATGYKVDVYLEKSCKTKLTSVNVTETKKTVTAKISKKQKKGRSYIYAKVTPYQSVDGNKVYGKASSALELHIK
ncbi:MAG: leucine-rich repeat protein [Erysipelotrichaceae bacterium]|nr:leucine-rich repeat protein [Erysipelotrichaceae bacterium]